MASAREIQSRMQSIKDTMKITSAMYMISSSKMQKAKKSLADTEPFFFAQQRVTRLPLGIVCTGFWEKRAADLRIIVIPLGKKQIDRIALKIILQQIIRLDQRKSVCLCVIPEDDVVAVQKLFQHGKRTQARLHFSIERTFLNLRQRYFTCKNVQHNSFALSGLNTGIVF